MIIMGQNGTILILLSELVLMPVDGPGSRFYVKNIMSDGNGSKMVNLGEYSSFDRAKKELDAIFSAWNQGTKSYKMSKE